MTDRSVRREVRNPILALPSAKRLADLDPSARAVLTDILKELSADAAIRAADSWRKHKGPMAVYWKAVSVYAKHVRLALRGA